MFDIRRACCKKFKNDRRIDPNFYDQYFQPKYDINIIVEEFGFPTNCVDTSNYCILLNPENDTKIAAFILHKNQPRIDKVSSKDFCLDKGYLQVCKITEI